MKFSCGCREKEPREDGRKGSERAEGREEMVFRWGGVEGGVISDSIEADAVFTCQGSNG